VHRTFAVVSASLLCVAPLFAQDSYEIQVYGSETLAPAATMLELHTNYAFDGIRQPGDGTLSSDHALHETVELTHGFASWFEIGAYLFTSSQAARGFQVVGSHLRPRIRAPEAWHWPVGLSLSMEVGYVRSPYAATEWTWEVRPIVDQKLGRFYWALNPTLEFALSGPDRGQAPDLGASAKAAFDLSRVVTAGVEYYAGFGPLSGFSPGPRQSHSIFPSLDLELGSDWECNMGLGIGLTPATDNLIGKLIIGRRL
jgi:hypothetical protein